MVKTCVVRRASFVAALLFAPVSLHAQDIIGIPVGETPPRVTLESLNGDSVRLSQWIGKEPVIVEFWATCADPRDTSPRQRSSVIAAKSAVDRTSPRTRR